MTKCKNCEKCKHELEICEDCGQVFCKKCGKEWVASCDYTIAFPPYYGETTHDPFRDKIAC